ncbi:MAG: HTH-type transcriptional regulator DmlR [Herbaspirillum frisingense]|uniref:HTH-type transcriptional regulator DmlR n=1 Tax=Herbaspirillum frisingense TaxID=92645 RepID=A0A7V8FZW2_9BURK|nr:MAG: HTH-type transcriptional regulator DmlR [Herbaspirillum frisingense]
MATDRLGDMRLFAETAALGSLSAAGRKLQLSPAAASARLSKLETALQTRLFDRNTRQLRLTEEGQRYLHHCLVALRAIDDAEAALQSGKEAIRGKIRLSASADFGRRLLNDWLGEFCARHPEVKIALTLSDSLSDLLHDDIDLAIRFGAPADGTLVARRLAPNWRVLCAAPAYLARHGAPQSVADLASHDFIVLVTATGPLNVFHFEKNGRRQRHTVALERAWETSDGALARDWALAGRGIARKVIWDVIDDIRAGTLKPVLSDDCISEAGVHAVFHGTRYMPPRVRALLDFLIVRFEEATADLLSEASLPAPR